VEGEELPHSTGRITCPRCGQPISYIERHRRNGHVYYYAVHYLGYERAPDGRVLKRLRKCYLGPDLYSYVSGTHGDLGLTFRGLAERGRELEYLEGLVRALEGRLERGELDRAQALELAGALAQLSERLARLSERLRGRAGPSGAQA
jgi:hypothetical protein